MTAPDPAPVDATPDPDVDHPPAVRLTRRLADRLDARDREALLVWGLSRVAILVTAAMSGWIFYRTTGSAGAEVHDVVPFLDRWVKWDFFHYRAVAEVWYASRPTGVPLEVFFPGFPFTLWLLHGVGIPHVLGGVIVSALAGAVAMVALSRLAEQEIGPGGGPRTVLLMVLAPPAVFLAAPYTEALFLAFAIPAWLAARRGHWPAAALLCAGAAAVRVTGLFLAVALVVEFVTSARRDWRQAPWLALAFSTVAAYAAYLWASTGDPLRWLHAQEEGWQRTFTSPVTSLDRTIDGALHLGFAPDYAWQFRAEIVAAAVGALVTIGLLVWRRWGEATYIGLSVVALTTSYWFFSIPRASLLWFPLFVALAAITLRWRWTYWTYLAVSVPIMVVWAAAFTAGVVRWTG